MNVTKSTAQPARAARCRCSPVGLLFAALAGLAACAPASSPPAAASGATPGAAPAASPAPAPQARPLPRGPLWQEAQLAAMMEAYHQALGKRLVLELLIYDTASQVKVQDPAKPENVDEYSYSNGEVGKPKPVKLIPEGSDARLEDNLFDWDKVALDRIPALVEEASRRIKIEGGVVSMVSVRRKLPFSKAVEIDVDITGTRKNGTLVANAKGKVLSAGVD